MAPFRLPSRKTHHRDLSNPPKLSELYSFASILARPKNAFFVFVVVVIVYLTFFRREQSTYVTPAKTSVVQSAPTPVLDLGFYGQDDGSSHRDELISDDGLPAPSRILARAYGNVMFERLYFFEGTFYIVDDHSEMMPDLSSIMSHGLGMDEWEINFPTAEDIQIISPQQARTIFPSRPILLGGTSFVCTDHPQYLDHYYHYAAEVLLSQWRTYITLDTLVSSSGHTSLAAPRRIVFPHLTYDRFRDKADMNLFVVRAAFGSIEHLFERDWKEFAAHPHVYVFDRAVIFDRGAAERGPAHKSASKCIAEAFSLPKVPNWWLPLRNSVVDFAKAAKGEVSMPSRKPVVTYVSRQLDRRGRRLKDTEHDALVAALQAAEKRYGFELNVVQMEKVPKVEQIKLLGRTTVLMGVHGNGLSGMLWMGPSRQSTVMEFFIPTGFRRDYELTAKYLGHQYYGFWNDTHFVDPGITANDPDVNGPYGLNGPNFIIHGPTVVDLLVKILSLR